MRQRFIQSFSTSGDVQTAVDNMELGKAYVAYVEDGQYIDWNTKSIDYAGMYFTIEALEDGNLTVNLSCSYSKNGGDWTSISPEATISAAAGDEIRFKGNLDESANGMFSGNTLSSNIYGNIMSLKYGDNFKGQTTVFSLQNFLQNNTGLKSAENLVLPATTLAENCYYGMFKGCTSLTTAPELPATTLAISCYQEMFYNCISLTQAPELIARNGVSSCYNFMFYACASLHYIKCLLTNPAGGLLGNVRKWVQYISQTGTFAKNPAATSWTTGNDGIPTGWTVVDAEV